jgi:hypothetical protein
MRKLILGPLVNKSSFSFKYRVYLKWRDKWYVRSYSLRIIAIEDNKYYVLQLFGCHFCDQLTRYSQEYFP